MKTRGWEGNRKELNKLESKNEHELGGIMRRQALLRNTMDPKSGTVTEHYRR